MVRKGSIVHDYDAMKAAIDSSSSIKEVIEKLGLRAAGGTYKFVKDAARKHGLDLPVYDEAKRTVSAVGKNKIPDERVFIENSQYSNRTSIKKRLRDDYGWEWKCMNQDCPSPTPEWAGKPLSLQLEHINGVHNDNRVENLMFLCPNCHSQTDTYAGKTKKRLCDCGNPVSNNSRKYCGDCWGKDKHLYIANPKREVIEWPPVEVIVTELMNSNYTKYSKVLGVSDVAIRKRLASKGVDPKTLTCGIES